MCVSKDTGDRSDGSATNAFPAFIPPPDRQATPLSSLKKGKYENSVCGSKQNPVARSGGGRAGSNTEQSSGFQKSLLALF